MVDFKTQFVETYFEEKVRYTFNENAILDPKMFYYRMEHAETTTYYAMGESYTTRYVDFSATPHHDVPTYIYRLGADPFTAATPISRVQLQTVAYINTATEKAIEVLARAMDQRRTHIIVRALFDALKGGGTTNSPIDIVIDQTVKPDGVTGTSTNNRLNLNQIIEAIAQLGARGINRNNLVLIAPTYSILKMLHEEKLTDSTYKTRELLSNNDVISGMGFLGSIMGVELFGVPEIWLYPDVEGGFIPEGTGADMINHAFILEKGNNSPLCTFKAFDDMYIGNIDGSRQSLFVPQFVSRMGAGVMFTDKVAAIKHRDRRATTV